MQAVEDLSLPGHAALSEAGYDILVIDKQKSAFRRLSDSFQGLKSKGIMRM